MAFGAQEQDIVDQVFRECMARDARDLHTIREAVRARLRQTFGDTTTDQELQIGISRNAMGQGQWDYYPAYSTPPRYVSRARVLELAAKEIKVGLDVWERQELDAQIADLSNGIAHWKARHQRAREKAEELDSLIQVVRHHPLGVGA